MDATIATSADPSSDLPTDAEHPESGTLSGATHRR